MKGDISVAEDLAIAVMNLISVEEHAVFSGMKTGKLEDGVLGTVRELRKRTMKELIGEPEGEVWCMSKHLLSATMRLIEVGLKNGDAEKFEQASETFSLFWKLNQGGGKTRKLKSARELLRKVLKCCEE